MQYNWLNKKIENKKLIVFFNGWAMNETPVKHLEYDDYDVLMFFDYTKIDFDFSIFDFNKYEKKYLICWSMGVYAVNLFYRIFKDFNKKIAINGTTKIIDDKFGIPEKIYEITLRLLDDETSEKFIKNMFDNGNLNPEVKITRTLDEIKEELISIQNIKLKNMLDFDKAIISSKDRVVSTKNQTAFWQDKTEIKKINSTHCPFGIYKSWQEIIYE